MTTTTIEPLHLETDLKTLCLCGVCQCLRAPSCAESSGGRGEIPARQDPVVQRVRWRAPRDG